MSKHTHSSLFIYSSIKPAAEFYQHLLAGITTYEQLGRRALKLIKTAHALRQVDRTKELSDLLVRIPIKEYQTIGQYYLIWCRGKAECDAKVLECLTEQTQAYRSKALISRGSLDLDRGNPESALYFYSEALKANPTITDYVAASRGIALVKSIEGFNTAALQEIEGLIPLLRHAEPLTYYDVLNSYAVELVENDKLSEAHNASLVATSSRFAPFYPEWTETLRDVESRRKRRSTVRLTRSRIEPEYEPETELSEITRARIEVVIEFMNANYQRAIPVTELAEIVNLSMNYFIRLFKLETGLSSLDYLTRLRLEKAGELLRTTFLSVKQVMAKVGYNSKGHFSGQFKRQFGVTPLQYRKNAFAHRLPFRYKA